MVGAAIRTILAQPDADHVHSQLDAIDGMLGRQFPQVEAMLRDAEDDLLAFTAFPIAHWKKILTTNPLRVVNKEIRRRTPPHSSAWPARSWSRRTTNGRSATAATSGRHRPDCVWIGCGFRRPSPAQAAALQPTWEAALRITATAGGNVELYVATAPMPNANAAGRRSVAVTSRVVEDYRAGRLPQDELVHELRHAITEVGSADAVLGVAGRAMPVGDRPADRARRQSGRRQPRRGLLVVVVAGWAVAVVRAAHQGRWTAGGVLTLLRLTAALGPLLDAAISRRSEFAADRFAADHGLAVPLAAALHTLDDGRPAVPGRWRRLRASHPTPEERIRGLGTTTAHHDGVCHVVCQRSPSSPVPTGPQPSAHLG